MLDYALLAAFIPTFFVVSLTPGMCMTLAMTLGMRLGLRRTLWMMWGELLGVATVALAAVFGVAALMLNYPALFDWLKLLGGIYLMYLGIKTWNSPAHFTTEDEAAKALLTPGQLFSQGFITAAANPKGWAFMIALLPPFISQQLPLAPQLSALLAIILVTEFFCMTLYATGGNVLYRALNRGNKVQWLNRGSGFLLMVIGVWLAFF